MTYHVVFDAVRRLAEGVGLMPEKPRPKMGAVLESAGETGRYNVELGSVSTEYWLNPNPSLQTKKMLMFLLTKNILPSLMIEKPDSDKRNSHIGCAF